ncbi:MAG: hypothetical protein ABSB35_42780 [Bryobacteraceae bacterium]
MHSAKVCAAVLFCAPLAALCAVFTTRLQPGAVAAWDKYIERAELRQASRPILEVNGESPVLIDLNPDGDNGGEDVPNGYIHHWIGAVRIPGITVAAVEAVLEDYDHYARIYSPDLKFASASKSGGDAGQRSYDVRLITEQVQGIGLHFAFDVRSRVQFKRAGGDGLVESRSYLIRESNSGKAPYTDLLPEGNDHGILWRLNSYWRLRQLGTSVYAECQAISLSRKPFPGMHDLIKNRAKDSLSATILRTRNRVLGSGAP